VESLHLLAIAKNNSEIDLKIILQMQGAKIGYVVMLAAFCIIALVKESAEKL
jgi:hypothetical protein